MGRDPHPHFTDGRWRFTYKGTRYSRSTEARAWKKLDELKGDVELPRGKPLTVDALIEQWERTRGNEHAAEMLDELSEWAGSMDLEDVTADMLERFARHLQTRTFRRWKKKPKKTVDVPGRRLGLETIRKKVIHAAAVLRWAHSRKLVDAMPDVPKLPRPAPSPKALSDFEVDKLIADLESTPRGKKFRPLIQFILETGCRPGEARTLKWGDVDKAHGVAVLNEHKTAGSGSTRVIRLTSTAMGMLESLDRSGPWVFRNYRGQPYTRDGFAAIVRRRGIHPYQLRHTWCQRACDRGVPEEIIQEIMGHGSARMIRMYRRISDARMKAAVSALDGLSRPSSPIPAPVSKPAGGSRSRPKHPPGKGRNASRGSRQHSAGETAMGGASPSTPAQPGERQTASSSRPARRRTAS